MSEKWTVELSVNNEVIDEQHKEWFIVMDDLYKSISDKKPIETIEDALLKVLEYTRFHFKYEENYMQENKFSNLEEHKSQHLKYVREIEKYYEELMTGRSKLSEEIVQKLNNWFLNHIKNEDLKYSVE